MNVHYNDKTDTVQIYYNGEWVDWKIANLQNKVVFDADNQPYTFVSYKPSAGSWTFTQNADNLYGYSYNANTFGIFSALVDVTDYTKMTVHFTSITIKNWGYVSIEVGDTSSSVSRTASAYRYAEADGKTSTVSDVTVSLSIADLSGDKYVGIQLGSGTSSSTASFYVDKIILEK